jgi:hypothetical protein
MLKTLKEHEGKVVDFIVQDRKFIVIQFTDGSQMIIKAGGA